MKAFVTVITIISLLCTGIAQIVAISTGSYYLNTSIDKRCACQVVHKDLLIEILTAQQR